KSKPQGNKPGSVIAEPLTEKPGNTTGSSPGSKCAGWDHVVAVDRELLNPKTDLWGPKYWVKMHLLSEKLHGPGQEWNLVSARKTDNSAMANGPESDAKNRISNKEVLYYDVSVNSYHSGKILEDFPANINVKWGSMKKQNNKYLRDKQLGNFPLNLGKPPLNISESALIDIKSAGRDLLISLGLSRGLAGNIQKERTQGGGNFQDKDDFIERMKKVYQNQSRPVDFMAEHWHFIQALIDSGKAKL
ncbi:MAG: hypothetical protein F6K10_39000, partial [Moorea sp. SIO2B7]|nr:hypothetical protein [Moorena sp. SIO2B7]